MGFNTLWSIAYNYNRIHLIETNILGKRVRLYKSYNKGRKCQSLWEVPTITFKLYCTISKH